ncbi:MAG TPA: nuclear transport factor 2 family protein [Actinomycetes bacterium]|nr:nuclear transport factor 2 family protein [Actinomycetes bacterium]
MTAAERVATVRLALQAAATGNAALLERACTADVEGWSPTTTVTSREALLADVRGRSGAFSDVELVLDPVDAVGDDKVIAEWRLAATHSGALELEHGTRLDPTGRRVELRGVLVAEFQGDRIKRFRQYWDEAALLEGLGMLPGS